MLQMMTINFVIQVKRIKDGEADVGEIFDTVAGTGMVLAGGALGAKGLAGKAKVKGTSSTVPKIKHEICKR